MRIVFVIVLSILANVSLAQRVEAIPYGDFENWLVRDIEESFVIGGKTQRIYAIAPNGNKKGPVPYRRGVSPWGSSNALAIVSMVTKTSNTTFPEVRPTGGRCAKMETSMVSCKVLGLINITVMVAGTVFLGETIEPIKDTKDPYTKLDMGIPFTGRPSALIYDYNTMIRNSGVITTAKGWSVDEARGTDAAQVMVLLQNRKELPDGSIVAQRVGTGKEYISKSSNGWVTAHRLPINYGDITYESYYKLHMGLTHTYFARNSKGVNVRVRETAWAPEGTPVTHAIVFMSSSRHEAFVGEVGNIFRVDNVKFEYAQ